MTAAEESGLSHSSATERETASSSIPKAMKGMDRKERWLETAFTTDEPDLSPLLHAMAEGRGSIRSSSETSDTATGERPESDEGTAAAENHTTGPSDWEEAGCPEIVG